MENRHGLLMDLRVTGASGTAEREAALDLLSEHVGTRATVGADKSSDTRSFVAESRAIGVTPHVAKNEHARRRSAIDGRTTRHPGYGISQTLRMTIERIFGWTKIAAGFRRTRFRGKRKTQFGPTSPAPPTTSSRISRLRGSSA